MQILLSYVIFLDNKVVFLVQTVISKVINMGDNSKGYGMMFSFCLVPKDLYLTIVIFEIRWDRVWVYPTKEIYVLKDELQIRLNS